MKQVRPLIHGSMYSGACNGFSLGARYAGIETAWTVENDPFCNSLLDKNFPNAKRILSDEHLAELTPVDIISGGPPCQGFSMAGKRKGALDPRNRWPKMRSAIERLRPTYVLFENVKGIIPLYLDTVLSDLGNLGYATEAFCLPSLAFGSPSVRERVYVVSYPKQIQWTGNIPDYAFDRFAELLRQSKGVKNAKTPSDYVESVYGVSLQSPPDPGAFRSHIEFPDWLDRLGALGNANDPLISWTFFEFIKNHHQLCHA